MKTKLPFLVFCIMTLLLTSCGGSQMNYLEFQGIPMTGTTASFAKQLESKGYKVIQKSEDESVYAMHGPFWRYDDVIIQFHIADDTSVEDYSVVIVDITDGRGAELDEVFSDLYSDISFKYFPDDLPSSTLYETKRKYEIELENGSIIMEKIGGNITHGGMHLMGITEIGVVYKALNSVQMKEKTDAELKIKERKSSL